MADLDDLVLKLRRMVNEPTSSIYSDEILEEYITEQSCTDDLGNEPYLWDYSTTPATHDANPDWVATYDLNAAAAEIWDEKASTIQDEFDFSADGGDYKRSQKYRNATTQAARYRSRSKAKSFMLKKYPKEISDV